MDCQLKQAALPLSGDGQAMLSITMARDDRLIYSSPACDVDRTDVVGMVDEVARLASELGRRFLRLLKGAASTPNPA
jgi:hypothetical protein